MKPTSTTFATNRLASLDILRGFDLFLLVFFQPVLFSLGQKLNLPWLNEMLFHFDHEVWEGFRFWDIVMPLFLFMAGTSMPFSFSKFKDNPDKSAIHRKIIKRFILLFFFGMIVQGNLLGFDPDQFYFYNNTLQAIAAGYIIAAFILLHTSFRTQIVMTIALLLVYTLPMMLFGDYSLEGNFAYKVDALLMGRFRGDASYTWIWSSLTFGVTVLLGTFAGRIMKEGKDNRKRVVIRLFAIGISLVIAGWLWSFEMPIIKRIWSGSMTLLSGGYCFLLMTFFYYVIDYKGYHRGMNWLKFYGMNSITAYILGETINFRSAVQSVSYGLQPYLGDFYSTWLTFGNFLILFFILRWMFKHQIFLKI